MISGRRVRSLVGCLVRNRDSSRLPMNHRLLIAWGLRGDGAINTSQTVKVKADTRSYAGWEVTCHRSWRHNAELATWCDAEHDGLPGGPRVLQRCPQPGTAGHRGDGASGGGVLGGHGAGGGPFPVRRLGSHGDRAAARSCGEVRGSHSLWLLLSLKGCQRGQLPTLPYRPCSVDAWPHILAEGIPCSWGVINPIGVSWVCRRWQGAAELPYL
jgi:hypothetical protein